MLSMFRPASRIRSSTLRLSRSTFDVSVTTIPLPRRKRIAASQSFTSAGSPPNRTTRLTARNIGCA